MDGPRTYTARWVFPVTGPPLARGLVTVRGERIEAVEPHGTRAADEDLGNVGLIPGLANPHTHLDLSGARGRAPTTDPDHFPDWLRGVIAYRRSRTPEQTQQDIRDGLAECLRHGTTLVGDIAAEGQTWGALAAAPLRAVVFRELIGLTPSGAERAVEASAEWTERADTPTCRKGLSPHAPYSARQSLIAAAGRLCRESVPKRPLAVHLAESLAEVELLHHRRGPFVTFLKELGVWDPDGLADDFEAVMRVCDFRQPKVFAHGNHLSPSARIPRNSTIVYCPRTHSAFGHPPHPFREFLARRVPVCLGTDSLASNPDLDVLAEARFVRRRYPEFPGARLLWMVTLAGAEALGWAEEAGSLEAGKSADAVAVPLPDRGAADPHELLFAEDAPGGGRRTMFRGRWRDPLPPQAVTSWAAGP